MNDVILRLNEFLEKENTEREKCAMKTYCISDIHGRYDLLVALLEKIQLKNEDTLYILGDILDRGANPIKIITKLMEMPNAVCIVGNHEMMALECLKFLMQEVTDTNLEQLDEKMLDKLMTWQYNGADTTIDEFRKLNREMQQLVLEFLEEFLPYEEVTVKGNKYLLVHGGLGGFYQGKEMHDYSIRELVWDRIDYDKEYYPDTNIITGHTPTQEIAGNPNPGYIYRKNNHIAIDCGACMPEGRLAAICLDTGAEFYVSDKNMGEKVNENLLYE